MIATNHTNRNESDKDTKSEDPNKDKIPNDEEDQPTTTEKIKTPAKT